MYAGLDTWLPVEDEVIQELGLRHAGAAILAETSSPVLDWITPGVGSRLALSARFRSPPPEAGGEMLQVACPDLTVTSSGRAAAYDLDRSRHANHPQPPALRRLRSSAQQSALESWAVRHRRSAERRLPEDRRTGSASPPPPLRAPCHEP